MVEAAGTTVDRASRLAQFAHALIGKTGRQNGVVNSCISVQGQMQSTVGGKRGLSCSLCAPRVYNVCRGVDAMLLQDAISQRVCLNSSSSRIGSI